VLRVKDTGVGIAPGLLSKVFDLFVQAEQGPDRTQGGLGIGLTLVKSLVEMHGGTVAAHSDGPGRGSAFTVRLPRAAAGAAGRTDRSRAPPGPRVRPRRVLVVDDNKDAAESMTLLLRLQGHEVARRLRAREGGTRALLIAVTGYGQDEDRRRAEEAGFDHLLVKPPDPRTVEALMSGRAGKGG
jgi:CheY-like chemotaxis protein